MKVHEKMTYAAKVNHKTRAMIRPADSDEEQAAIDEAPAGDKAAVAVKDDPQFVIAVTRGMYVLYCPVVMWVLSIDGRYLDTSPMRRYL